MMKTEKPRNREVLPQFNKKHLQKTYSQCLTTTTKKSTVNTTLKDERLLSDAKTRNKTRISAPISLTQHGTEVSANAIMQEKELKGIQIRK